MKNLNNIIIYAFRYALGRNTYAVSDVCSFIERNIAALRKNDVELIIKEIDEADEKKQLGDGTNKDLWIFLRNELYIVLKTSTDQLFSR